MERIKVNYSYELTVHKDGEPLVIVKGECDGFKVQRKARPRDDLNRNIHRVKKEVEADLTVFIYGDRWTDYYFKFLSGKKYWEGYESLPPIDLSRGEPYVPR